MPSVADIARALRRRSVLGPLVVAGVFVGVLLVARSCQRGDVEISSENAVAIARREIDFRPEGHTVRLLHQGIPPKRYWAVSFWIRDPGGQSGAYRKLTIVLVDARTGRVSDVRVQRS